MYPAFLVSDVVHEQFDSLEEVPDTYRFNWITAGRPYAEDMWDYDVYEEIGNYTEKVLLMHGSADGIVPISYSERAAEVYEDAEYYVIEEAGNHNIWFWEITNMWRGSLSAKRAANDLPSKPCRSIPEPMKNCVWCCHSWLTGAEFWKSAFYVAL